MKLSPLFILIALCPLLIPIDLKAQNTGIKPQYWNNATVAWEANEYFLFAHTLSYNVLIDKELPWSEFSMNNTAAFLINDLLSANGGLYLATSKQSNDLNSFEIRPYLGFRVTSKRQKRAAISNLSRIEWRHLDYSNNTSNSDFRFRNRTTGVLAINQQSILDQHVLLLFAYFEAFHNFNQEIEERYFTSYKYKAGLKYRFSAHWGMDAGVLFNNSRNTIFEPSQAPTNVVTNFILEWGATYIF